MRWWGHGRECEEDDEGAGGDQGSGRWVTGRQTEAIDSQYKDRKLSRSLTALLASGGDHMAGRGKEKEGRKRKGKDLSRIAKEIRASPTP